MSDAPIEVEQSTEHAPVAKIHVTVDDGTADMLRAAPGLMEQYVRRSLDRELDHAVRELAPRFTNRRK